VLTSILTLRSFCSSSACSSIVKAYQQQCSLHRYNVLHQHSIMCAAAGLPMLHHYLTWSVLALRLYNCCVCVYVCNRFVNTRMRHWKPAQQAQLQVWHEHVRYCHNSITTPVCDVHCSSNGHCACSCIHAPCVSLAAPCDRQYEVMQLDSQYQNNKKLTTLKYSDFDLLLSELLPLICVKLYTRHQCTCAGAG
jgi:hypothetical protein